MRVLENYPVVTRGGSQHGYIDVIKVSGSTIKYKVDWDNGSTCWVNTTDVIVRDPNCISENDLCPVGYDLIGEEVRIVDSNETGIISGKGFSAARTQRGSPRHSRLSQRSNDVSGGLHTG